MYKKIYDENKGIFVYVDNWTRKEKVIEGSGIIDTLASVGQKIFSSSAKNVAKKALESAGKAALESGTKKIGSEVGNFAADKMINAVKKKEDKPKGDLIVKELTKLNGKNDNKNSDINIRINKLMSGLGSPKGLSNRQNRINKLIYKI